MAPNRLILTRNFNRSVFHCIQGADRNKENAVNGKYVSLERCRGKEISRLLHWRNRTSQIYYPMEFEISQMRKLKPFILVDAYQVLSTCSQRLKIEKHAKLGRKNLLKCHERMTQFILRRVLQGGIKSWQIQY